MEFTNIKTRSLTTTRGLLLAICYLLSLTHSIECQATRPLLDEIDQLDQKFRKLSFDIYQTKSDIFGNELQRINNITQLSSLVNKSIDKSDDITAIRLLYRNKELVINNVDSQAIFTFIKLLLRNNEWTLANKIYSTIKEDGERSLLANANFIFAKYYSDRHNWNRTNELLNGSFSELTPGDATYAYLLKGVALQNLKKHREAIKYYRKIPIPSQYYREAQLNIAIANIRQGWWTDAYTIIKKVTSNSSANTHNEQINRLHLVLGYALLQRDYYRNARDEFRHITLDSRYANRALLGIGLTAASQGDYVGGLNALSILKEKKTLDLSVDESYLLLPYMYDQLQQEATVSASYTEAMSYYKKRISFIKQLTNEHKTFTLNSYDDETTTIAINNSSFDYADLYPESYIQNYRLLQRLAKRVTKGSLATRIKKLLNDYDITYQHITNSLLERRLSYLNSYLNQSRYGLAKFFDKSREKSKAEQEAELPTEPKAAPEAKPQTEPQAEPQAELQIDQQAEQQAELPVVPQAAPEATPQTEPQADPLAEPQIDQQAEPQVELKEETSNE